MSVKILQGSLDTLEILLFISDSQFITSGDIRRKFEKIKAGTMDDKLRKLHNEGVIEIKQQKIVRAGDDRYGYKLTKYGVVVRKELLQKTMRILDPEIRKTITLKTTSEHESKNQDKKELINEFLHELEINLNEKQIKTLQTKIVQLFKEFEQ